MERWLIGILLVLLTLNVGFINYILVKEFQKPFCVFDIQRFVDYLSTWQITEKEADNILNEVKTSLERMGCKAVFVRGALITGYTRDITEEVINVVKNLHGQTAK